MKWSFVEKISQLSLFSGNKPQFPDKDCVIHPDEFLWIDEFINNVRPYIFVRLEDNLLIKRPNMAQKINPTGARILKSLLEGMSINRLLTKIDGNPQKVREILNFIIAVKMSLENKLDEFTLNPAVEVKPFTMKFSDYPVLSEIAITYRCNLKCKFCYAGCNCTGRPSPNEKEMTTSEIKTLIDKIVDDAKVPSISFTGGEPTLRPELPELIRHAKKRGMWVNLITNGVNIDRDYAAKLADSGLNSAQVSIEGVTAQTHDQLVQYPGAFLRSIAAVRLLNEAKIPTHPNATLNRLNLAESAQYPHFVKNELGVGRFSMNLIIPTGSSTFNRELYIRYEEMPQIIQNIIAESEKNKVTFMWYSPLPMCIFNTISHGLGNKGCSACDGLISIAPNGDVLPCASYDQNVGNLLNYSLDQIWNSKNAASFRNKDYAHHVCKACEYFHVCNGACPLYWREIGYNELLEIKKEKGLTHV